MPNFFPVHRHRLTIIAAFTAGLACWLAAAGNPGWVSRAEAGPICESSGIPIWITIEKVRSSSGTIKVELYSGDTKVKRNKGKKIARTRVKAQEGETRLCLNAPSAGNYSVALYHDENNNRKFDRNFLGIPREGFGFSNNPPVRLGLPALEEVRFKVQRMATSLRISVVYM